MRPAGRTPPSAPTTSGRPAAEAARVPDSVEAPTYALWGRGAVERHLDAPDVLGFDAEDVLT
ncbi:MAG TPA: hypothetical protein VFF24_07760 [Acidimicrobiia bacterium]|nr:hypothetical protein [Acidimicrobiia bacterium]